VKLTRAVESTISGDDWLVVNASVSDANDISAFFDFDDSLAVWMRMDDIDGPGNPVDYMDNQNGTAMGDAAQTNDGKLGKAFEFGGDGDYIDAGSGALVCDRDTFSISAWFKTTTNDTVYIYSESDSTDTVKYCMIDIYSVGSTLRGIYSDGMLPVTVSETGVNDGEWHHVVYVRKAADSWELFFDGSSVDTDSTGLNTLTTINNAKIGGFNSSGTTGYFDGEIDDVMLFTRSLDAEEVSGLYASGSPKTVSNSFTGLAEGDHTFKAYAQDVLGNVNFTEERTVTLDIEPAISFIEPTPANGSSQVEDSIFVNVSASDISNFSAFIDFDDSLVSWWRMDDIDAWGNPTDYMGNNDGQTMGDASQTNDGYFGKGFEFDGDGDCISVDDLVDDVVNATTGTLSLWIYSNLDDSTKTYEFAFGDTDGNTFLAFGIHTGTLRAKFKNDGGTLWYVRTDSNPDDYHNWMHIALVQDGTEPAIYINGEKPAQTLTDEVDKTVWLENVSHLVDNARIGCYDKDSSGPKAFFDGTIDDVMIFNRALSAQEIAGMYAGESPRLVSQNFTGLDDGTHTFKAYAQDIWGHIGETEERIVTIF
jgi:hypothetical protein